MTSVARNNPDAMRIVGNETDLSLLDVLDYFIADWADADDAERSWCWFERRYDIRTQMRTVPLLDIRL